MARFERPHQGVVAVDRIHEPIATAPRCRRRDAYQDAVTNGETADSNTLDVAPGEAMLTPVRGKRDALRIQFDAARKMEREETPRDASGNTGGERGGKRAARMEKENGEQCHDEPHVLRRRRAPPSAFRIRMAHFPPRSRFAIFWTSASMPMPVRNESVRTIGLPLASSTSVVDTTRSYLAARAPTSDALHWSICTSKPSADSRSSSFLATTVEVAMAVPHATRIFFMGSSFLFQ